MQQQRTVRREIIDAWIAEKYPNALTKLSLKSGVSANSISKIRSGRVPKGEEQRQALAKALGVAESDLFPEIRKTGRAS